MYKIISLGFGSFAVVKDDKFIFISDSGYKSILVGKNSNGFYSNSIEEYLERYPQNYKKLKEIIPPQYFI